MTHDPSKTTPAPASLFDEDEADLSLPGGSPVHVGVISDATKAAAKVAAHEIGEATKAEVGRAWKRSRLLATGVVEHVHRKRRAQAVAWNRTGLYVGVFTVLIACVGFYVSRGTSPTSVPTPQDEMASVVSNVDSSEERVTQKPLVAPTPKAPAAVSSANAATPDSKSVTSPTADMRSASTLAEAQAAPAIAMPSLPPGRTDAAPSVATALLPASSESPQSISPEVAKRPTGRMAPSVVSRPPNTLPAKQTARRPSTAAPVSSSAVVLAAGPTPSQLKAREREMPVAEESCTTAGTVLGAKGAALLGARVQLEGPAGAEVLRAETGEDGSFAFDVRSPSPRVRISVRAKGHLDYVAEARACQTLAPIVLTKSNPLSALRNVARRADRALEGLRTGDNQP